VRYRLDAGRLVPTSSPAPPATARAGGSSPERRRARRDRYVCRAASAPACSFRTWSFAAAQRHADAHGGGRIEVDLGLELEGP